MKIEKIKNFNQIILAIVGCIALLMLLFGFIMMIIEFIPSRNRYENEVSGLISDEKVETLNQENLRKQVISYENPWLIDTMNTKYIIPVSVKTLKKAEKSGEIYVYAEDEELLYSSSFSRSYKKGYYNSKSFAGDYANLIIYDMNGAKAMFDQRIFIGNTKAFYFNNDILLIFYTAEKDTNKDGIIDLNDQKSLYIYSLNTDNLRKITDQENSVYDYQFINNSKDLLVEIQLEQYKKDQFSSNQLPHKIMKYEYVSQKLTDVVPEDIQTTMQELVEGKIK